MQPFSYKGWDLFEAIDALMAYDSGVVDSGVSDEALRLSVRLHLESLDEDEFRRICAGYARRLLTDEAIAAGYGLEDVQSFIDWISAQGLSFRR
jgi:hypothetical protein